MLTTFTAWMMILNAANGSSFRSVLGPYDDEQSCLNAIVIHKIERAQCVPIGHVRPLDANGKEMK